MIKLTKLFSGMLFLIVCSMAVAATSPIDTVQTVSAQVIAELKAKQKNLKSDPNIAYQIIQRRLLPHVDVEGMARSVLGREIWSKASIAQRQQFVQAFTELLIRTYSKAFSAYTDESVKFYPVRGGVEGRPRVQIQSEVLRSNGPAIAVNYRMIQLGGAWKVYDFSVENISMLQSFRSQFNEELQRGGMAALLQKLNQHNAGSQ